MGENERSVDEMTKIVNVSEIALTDLIYITKYDGADRDRFCELTILKDLVMGVGRTIDNSLVDSNLSIPTGHAIADYIANMTGPLAVADYTDANILAMIISVDGPASGLNADMLDSAHISIDGTFGSNSDLKIPTEKAVKTYIDTKLVADRSLYDVKITNQTEFNATFDGTTLQDISIFLVDNGTPYVLNNTIQLKSNVIIHSNGAVVNKGAIGNRFTTTYKMATTSTARSGAIYTIPDTSGFTVGDTVRLDQDDVDEFNTILSLDATHITLIKESTNTDPTINIQSMTTGIETKGWIFDGQGGVNGLPGSIVETTQGGAFYVPYCAHSSFEAEVRNFNTTDSGGGYGGSNVIYKLIISNVHNCNANIYGGGISSCGYSEISNVYNCSALDYGGGVYGCNYSIISNIHHCTTPTNGGGVSYCEYSIISNVYNCIVSGYGGGVYDCYYSEISNIHHCTASNHGGGIYQCFYSIISNVYNCTADSGGGIYSCRFSIISNIHHCTASNHGGGIYYGHYSVISNVYNCTAGGSGGGASVVDYCLFLGCWNNNTGATTDNISSSANSWGFAHDEGDGIYLGIKTRAAIDWDILPIFN